MNLNQFKSLEFNKLTFDQLQSIGSSIGISKNSTRYCKEIEIYNKIEYILKLRDRLEKEEQLNSFNKDRVTLAIKDNLDPVELLFWNVFRSKIIFKAIFSNFKSDVYGYYQLIDINDILDKFTNGREIIKDKILYGGPNQLVLTNTNSYEFTTFSSAKKDSFNISYKRDGKPNKFKIIYKLFKDNNSDNQKLFNQLFNNYKIYFDNSNSSSSNSSSSSSNNNTIEYQLDLILKTLNSVALNQFIQHYSSNKDTLEFIKNKIYNHFTTLTTNNRNCSVVLHITTYNDLKIFNYLKSINNNHIQIIDNNNQLINNNNNNNNNNSIKFNITCSSLINKSIKLKRLNNIFKIITNNNLNNINNSHSDNSIIINQINQIIDNHLNNSALLYHKLESVYPIVYNNNNNDKILDYITIMIKLFKTISNENKDILYFDTLIQEFKLLDQEREKQITLENESYSTTKDIQSFIVYLKQFTNNLQLTFKDKSTSNTLIMKILQWIRNISSGIGNSGSCGIKQIYDNLGKHLFERIVKQYSIELLLEVKSKDELDFYFANYKDIFYGYDNSNYKYIKSIQLLEYYEQQMKSIGRFIMINNYKDLNSSDENESDYLLFKYIDQPLGRIIRAANNPSVYKFKVDFKFESYHQIILDYFNMGQSDVVIKIFKRLEIKEYVVPQLKEKRPYYINNNSFIKWIIENFQGDIIKDSIFKLSIDLSKLASSSSSSSSTLIEFEFRRFGFLYIGYFNKLYHQIIIKKQKWYSIYSLFMDIIVEHSHLSFGFINDIIQMYIKKQFLPLSELKNLIVGFFTYASIYGMVSVFEMLFLNYTSIFKNNKESQFIQVIDLKECLKYSIQCGHIELAELLSNYCKLTEYEFTKFINPNTHQIGYNHFKDKFIIKYDNQD